MLVVGLTGGIGAGKSTVARLLAEHGALVIDMDAMGREVIAPGGRAEAGVIAEFGPDVLTTDGAIDRAKLAQTVFSDATALSRLTSISHPAMNEELMSRLDAASPSAIVVLDLAVLVESQLGRLPAPYGYTFVVTVEANAGLREERAVERGLPRDDVRRRIAQQATDAQRRAVSDVVIANDDDVAHLQHQVDALWERLETMNGTTTR